MTIDASATSSSRSSGRRAGDEQRSKVQRVRGNVPEGLNHAALGFEYQVLDDSLNDDNKIPSHRAGSLYDFIPPDRSA